MLLQRKGFPTALARLSVLERIPTAITALSVLEGIPIAKACFPLRRGFQPLFHASLKERGSKCSKGTLTCHTLGPKEFIPA
eukprot:jgi/Botrbrau1/4300/Bobra.0390s0039.1